MRWRRVERAGWPTPEIAELMDLSGQLLRALLAVQGRHRPRLEDMELADKLAAYVLGERCASRQRKPYEKHAA